MLRKAWKTQVLQKVKDFQIIKNFKNNPNKYTQGRQENSKTGSKRIFINEKANLKKSQERVKDYLLFKNKHRDKIIYGEKIENYLVEDTLQRRKITYNLIDILGLRVSIYAYHIF